MTIVMVIMICVGCALILAGLAAVGYRVLKLARAARGTGFSARDYFYSVMRLSREVGLRVDRLSAKQRVLAERLQSLSASTARLNYLRDQLDQATGYLFKLKS